MSKKNFKDIVARAMTDDDFLNEFISDPVKATGDYNLSDEEFSALNTIDRKDLALIGDQLGERVSKGYLDLSLVLMLEEDPGHNSTHNNSHSSTHTKS